MPVPDALDWPAAGGFPEVFTTAHDMLFTQAGLGPGDRLLVHGAAGGVGTAAVQLARAAGARVTTTVRDEAKRAAVEELGADCGDRPRGLRRPRSVRRDPRAGRRAQPGRQHQGARDARAHLVIGIGAGAKAEINLALLMAKRGAVMASTLRARPLEEKAATARAVEQHVLPLVERGDVRVPVAETFPLDRAAEAYDRFAGGGKLGKIVLTMDGRRWRPPSRESARSARRRTARSCWLPRARCSRRRGWALRPHATSCAPRTSPPARSTTTSTRRKRSSPR